MENKYIAMALKIKQEKALKRKEVMIEIGCGIGFIIILLMCGIVA